MEKNDGNRDKYINELKIFFGPDQRRINHALKVLGFAEEILAEENLDQREQVIAAAVFHDIGIREAEKLYQSCSPKYQEELGPPLAREILSRLGCNEKFIGSVCEMIAYHHRPKRYEQDHPGQTHKPFHVLVDADLIVNVLEGDIPSVKGSRFYTDAGRIIAAREGCINSDGLQAGG